MSTQAQEIESTFDQRMVFFNQRLEFFGLNQSACAALNANQDIIRKALPQRLNEFASHVSNWPEAAAHFKTEDIKQRALSGQQKHWARIASGQFDQNYLKSSLMVGYTHNRIGLEPRWYIGGYATLTSGLVMSIIDEVLKNPLSVNRDRALLKDVLNAMIRGIFLDMDLAISTYLEAKDSDFNRYLGGLTDKLDTDMKGFLNQLSDASSSMIQCASHLDGLSRDGLSQAESMSAATERSSQSVQIVSAAAEELSASTQEINSQIARTTHIVQDAANQSRAARDSINCLKDAAGKINTVIQLITGITEQTNLLALNATIEAARAGDAGKGFAVVASEVKALANESGRASQEISELVRTIQSEVDRTVEVIEAVARTVAEVEEIATSVSSAVEQQSAATQEIVRSAMNAATGAKELSGIAVGVASNGNNSIKISNQVNTVAQDIESKTTTLREKLSAFVSSLQRAA